MSENNFLDLGKDLLKRHVSDIFSNKTTDGPLELGKDLLMRRLDLQDVPGFFQKTVEIPPGVRVIVFDNGVNLGELNSGYYTLEKFADKLHFWNKKKAVLYLFRGTSFDIDYAAEDFIANDDFTVAVKTKQTFILSDPFLLIRNLTSSEQQYSLKQLYDDTETTVLAALKSAVHQFTVADLNKPETRKYLDAAMDMAICSSFARYGLKFVSMTLLSVDHEGLDRIQQQLDDLRLDQFEHNNEKYRNEFDNERRLNIIKQNEKNIELDLLAKNVLTGQKEGDLSILKRKLGIDQELRKLTLADKFDSMSSDTELEKFLLETKKAGLIRDSELDELKKVLGQESVEKEKRRESALKIIDIQMERDRKDLVAAINHQFALNALDRQIELAQKQDTESNRKWVLQLEREREERKENLARILDKKEAIRAENDIAFENSLAKQKIQKVQLEMRTADEENRLELEKQREVWKLDLQKQAKNNQLERLAAIKKINREQSLFDMDIKERQQRLTTELDMLQRAQDQKFVLDELRMKLDKIEVIKDMGRAGELAILNAGQTQAYVELSKSDEVTARMEEQRNAAMSREQLRSDMMDQMQGMFKEMMASQERSMDRMVNMHSSTTSQVHQTVVLPGQSDPLVIGVSSDNVKKVIICPNCRTEVDPRNKFCPNCGGHL